MIQYRILEIVLKGGNIADGVAFKDEDGLFLFVPYGVRPFSIIKKPSLESLTQEDMPRIGHYGKSDLKWSPVLNWDSKEEFDPVTAINNYYP